MASAPNALVIQIVLEEPRGLFLDDLSAFLYDTALLNDATVLSGPGYDYEFNQYFLRRNGRKTRREDRAVVLHVRHESPILIELLVVASAAIGVFKGLEHVWYTKARWRREKAEQKDRELELVIKELEIERNRRELDDEATLITIDEGEPPIEIPSGAAVLQDAGAQDAYAKTVRRIQRSTLEIRELSTRRPRRGELPGGPGTDESAWDDDDGGGGDAGGGGEGGGGRGEGGGSDRKGDDDAGGDGDRDGDGAEEPHSHDSDEDPVDAIGRELVQT